MKLIIVMVMALSLSASVYTETKCIKGYLFAIASDVSGVSIVQIFEKDKYSTLSPKPMTCKNK